MSKELKYLLKSSDNNMEKWEDPSPDQVTFMNLYIKSMFGRETDKNKEALVDANEKGKVRYVSCKYLDKTIEPHGWSLQYPFGFYKLLSWNAACENHEPRTIFVYGIKAEDDYLLEAKSSSVHRHWKEDQSPSARASRALLPSSVCSNGTVVREDGEVLGKMRKDGMVVDQDGKVIGKMGPDGSIVGPGDTLSATSSVQKAGKIGKKKKSAKKKSAKKKSTKKKI